MRPLTIDLKATKSQLETGKENHEVAVEELEQRAIIAKNNANSLAECLVVKGFISIRHTPQARIQPQIPIGSESEELKRYLHCLGKCHIL